MKSLADKGSVVVFESTVYSGFIEDMCVWRIRYEQQQEMTAYSAVIPKFIRQLMIDEQPTINDDGKQSRDFTYIENVIEAKLKACLSGSGAAGEAFNVTYGGCGI